MELHHHPAEKRKLKEYLLEGLMIFIAVTMGFIAESLREHIGDKKKEYEYVHSLIADLHEDDISFGSTIAENYNKLHWLDSVLSLANKNLNDIHNRELLYHYSPKWISFYSAFGSNDATMVQLKSSGGLQYIKRAHVADSIAKYDQVMRGIYAAEKPYSKAIDDGMAAMSQVLVFSAEDDTTFVKKGHFTHKLLPLLTIDDKQLAIFFNEISLERGWTQNYINNLEGKRPSVASLITLLKKEYGEE